MVRYNQIIKNISAQCDKYDLFKLGEMSMNKTKEVYEGIYVEDSNVYSDFERTVKLYNTSLLLSNLSKLIDLKSLELSSQLSKIEEFAKKAKWLNEWSKSTKNDILLQANSNLLSLENGKLDKLQKRIYRYEKYFDLMEEEKNVLKKYEYTFNFLTQIPSQINLYVEEANNKYEKFEAKETIYKDIMETTSSSEDVFYFEYENDIAIAA